MITYIMHEYSIQDDDSAIVKQLLKGMPFEEAKKYSPKKFGYVIDTVDDWSTPRIASLKSKNEVYKYFFYSWWCYYNHHNYDGVIYDTWINDDGTIFFDDSSAGHKTIFD